VDEMCMKDIPKPTTGLQRVSDDSYTCFGITKGYDLKSDFWVIHANSSLNNYINNLYQESRFKNYRMVIA
jgi:hypothetical protein